MKNPLKCVGTYLGLGFYIILFATMVTLQIKQLGTTTGLFTFFQALLKYPSAWIFGFIQDDNMKSLFVVLGQLIFYMFVGYFLYHWVKK